MKQGTRFRPGRSRWTTASGWTMVLSAAGAVVGSLVGISSYPPLTGELALAGLSAVSAVVWVCTSWRARAGDNPFADPYEETRRPSRPLTYLFALGIPFSCAAALLLALTPTSAEGKETERALAAGMDEHTVRVHRVAADPAPAGRNEDGQDLYRADLVFRIPFDRGPQEFTLRAHQQVGRPHKGESVTLWFSPAHPEAGVRTSAPLDWAGWGRGFLLFWIVPFAGFASAAVKSQMAKRDVHEMRRFRPGVHLPALAILLLGVAALVPLALELDLFGVWSRVLALPAAAAPWLAVTWLCKADWWFPVRH
ncbi:hypothetical protein ABT160_14055 [Streptomyces sp. NPDC001941]|uniref:hypothetical protein n=1 Tax=Streptomyces sp. NPDC001941 TaxID=3154659 RepID=UPI0033272527